MVAFGLGKRAFRSGGIALIPEAEFTPDQQLKTGVFVISRIQHHAECGEMNVKAACKTAAVELSAADQLLKTHTEMKKLQKHDSNRPSSKTPRNLDERLLDFKSRMGDGYDIRSNDKGRIATAEKELGRKTGEADFLFYQDNCHGDRRIVFAPDKTQTR